MKKHGQGYPMLWPKKGTPYMRQDGGRSNRPGPGGIHRGCSIPVTGMRPGGHEDPHSWGTVQKRKRSEEEAKGQRNNNATKHKEKNATKKYNKKKVLPKKRERKRKGCCYLKESNEKVILKQNKRAHED